MATDGAIVEGASILRARKHLNRDGVFAGTGITKASVATFGRDVNFSGAVIGRVYASPLYVDSGVRGSGVLFVATASNYVYALGEADGKPLPGWPIDAGEPAQQPGTLAKCLNVTPIGITGTPAIDLATRLIVFDAVTGDAQQNVGAHTIQAWSIDAPTKGPVWAVDVAAKWPAFVPRYQQQRSAVLIVGGVAYVTFGSFDDCGPYHGWIIAVPLDNPAGAQAYMTPVVGGGLWGPGGPASDGTSVFAVTGNRIEHLVLDASPPWAGSNMVFRFDPSLTFTGNPTDFFVPADWDDLDRHDEDLGGSGPLVVDAPGLTPSALVVALGKNGKAYLLDRNNLGGFDGGPVASTTIFRGTQSPVGVMINAAAWATISSGTYIVTKGYVNATAFDCPSPPDAAVYDLVAVRLDPSAPNDMTTAWCAATGALGSPSITMSDESNDAIVWTEGAEGDNALHAWDLATGTPLYSSDANTLGPAHRFSAPIATPGRVLVAGDGALYAFKPAP
jgi:hypothetical protein